MPRRQALTSSPEPGRATVPARYALTLVSPRGDTESLGREGSALMATWHLRRTLRDEPPGSVGEAHVGRHLVARWRKESDGSLVVGPGDPDPFRAMPEASRVALFAALDAYDGDDPPSVSAVANAILGTLPPELTACAGVRSSETA